MAADLAQFDLLLQSLLSPDNNTRTQSEQAYEGIPIPSRLEFLIRTVRNADTSIETRSLANVLLRRLFTSNFEEFWPQVTEDLKNAIKKEMLLAVQEELTPPVRKKVCDALAELARNMIDEENNMLWPDFLKFLFECANSQDPGLRESALHIFTVVPGVFGNQQAHYIEVIKQMLGQSLLDREHAQVRFEAVKATTAFLNANDKEQGLLNHFRDLLPGVVQGVVESVNQQEDDALLKCMIELAENVPKYLRPQLESIIPLCLKVVSDANLPDSWRQLGLEVITTLSETAPAMVRKFSKFIPLLVPQVLALMVDLENDPDWSVQDKDEDEDEADSNAIAGESALDRLACALGGKTMLPHIVTNISQMMAHDDWRYRHAALMAISACAEGCHLQMETMLGNIMDAVMPQTKDPHPRVRYAACNAIGQLCTDFGPTFQKKFHQRIVSELLQIMDDEANPRVQAHGAAALVNFSEDCPKHILVTYLDVIVNKLEQVLTSKLKELLEKGTKLVLEQVVTTLASVADTAEEKFLQYYDRFMPCLKYIVQNATTTELRLLRGKTIECISLIGLAVGRERFMQDCNDVMQLLLKTQMDQEEMADDDPQISYMISAWARMCKILGKDFQQYLPLVMGPVLKAASLKPEVAVVDSEDMKAMENDSDWQFVTLGDQQSFGIRTAGLEEKATACQMLVCYARELDEAFAPYTEEVVKTLVPLLKFYFHDDVRIAASESLPFLIGCASIRGPEYLAQMWDFICPNLLKAIEIEPEQTVLPEHLNSLAKCVEKLGKGCLTDEYMKQLVQSLDKLLKDHSSRQEERQEKRKDEDYDEQVEESLLDEDDEDVYILSKVSDIIHSFFGTHKEAFLPIFEQIMPHFVKLLNPARSWPDRQWALCVWDDVLEHTGPISIKYQEFFLRNMLDSLVDKSTEVRQAAAYGIGVMAQFGQDVYADACAEAVPRLVQMIENPESKCSSNVNATENAISAVTKICKYNASKVNVEELIPRFIFWLPVTEDEDEAVHIYGYMCDLLTLNHPGMLGENSQNLPRIVAIIAESIYKEVIEPSQAVFGRMLQIVNQVKANEEAFQACVGALSQEQQEALSVALSKC
ncbi:importin-5-like [Haliotis cracherodii]|uniref:importin-5-like n=1 Tax=Haliotis cracherodii TaxID=6455 RepID=UPI0039ECF3BF